MAKEANSFEIIRKAQGRTLKISAVYSEETDDWNMLLFEGRKVIYARTTTNVFAESADMLNLELGK
jgi:hypothetical protein